MKANCAIAEAEGKTEKSTIIPLFTELPVQDILPRKIMS